MKKICLLILAISFCFSSYTQYVDLGLPSGTKWKSVNEAGDENGFYTYDEAIKAFGNKLPTKKQCKAWGLYFNSGGVYVSPSDRCSGQPVRLVQK